MEASNVDALAGSLARALQEISVNDDGYAVPWWWWAEVEARTHDLLATTLYAFVRRSLSVKMSINYLLEAFAPWQSTFLLWGKSSIHCWKFYGPDLQWRQLDCQARTLRAAFS